ncbi:hypothetical protein [Psychroserpens sp. Hel_I_66]|uniref:hypothetical protein n=1 Tax=Psychroserpens sp. Hel_I_66 TaxID=1250004 RepID=UPI0006458985|nr:hypothetical protein [Psychroserpens sp. Hel_I_66]
MTPTTPLTRTIEEAKKWSNAWQKKHPNISKAFRIPADDLLACFNEMGMKFSVDSNGKVQLVPSEYEPSVRAYLAIDDQGGEKLLIVGTTTDDGVLYKDIVKDERQLAAAGDPSPNGSGVYDFTIPCPAACDPSSPLFHNP